MSPAAAAESTLSVYSDETSVVALVGAAVRHRQLIVAFGIAGLLIGGIFGLTRPHTYTSHASFTADDQRGASAAGAVAGQLGLSALLGGVSQSTQLFLDVLSSPVVIGPVADSTYDVDTDSGPRRMTLITFYRPQGRTSPAQREYAIERLGSEVKGTIRPSGLIGVDVETTDRRLSQEIAVRVLKQLDVFSLERRQQRAANEAVFSQTRVADALSELRGAEGRMQAFLQQNRVYRNSPALTVEFDRLQRDVQFRQTIYTSVAQTYEQARIEEARNTPTVNIVETPSFPIREDPRWGGLKCGALGLVLGVVIGLLVALARGFFARAAEANVDDARELAMIRGGAVSDSARAGS